MDITLESLTTNNPASQKFTTGKCIIKSNLSMAQNLNSLCSPMLQGSAWAGGGRRGKGVMSKLAQLISCKYHKNEHLTIIYELDIKTENNS